MSEIVVYVLSSLLVVFFIYATILNILRLIQAIKNYRNKQSKTLEYYIKKCYGHFDDIPTGEELQEDIQILNDMIEKLKDQNRIFTK